LSEGVPSRPAFGALGSRRSRRRGTLIAPAAMPRCNRPRFGCFAGTNTGAAIRRPC